MKHWTTPTPEGANPHYHGKDSVAPPARRHLGGIPPTWGSMPTEVMHCLVCEQEVEITTNGNGRVFVYNRDGTLHKHQ